jgi:benzoyl-CoA reductase/2-hydroxyglutaryl-CoA dehydratase subunit BcrC/BadD/HgdB
MHAYFANLAAGIEAKLQRGEGGPSARKKLTLELARLGMELYGGERRVAWCGVLTPFDLLRALGVTSCFVEFVGAMLASTGGVAPMLEEAEQAGITRDGCGYHRAVLGAERLGLMPVPDFLIGTTTPCSGGLAVLETLAHRFRKDLFVIHVPHGRDEEAVRYLAGQLRALVDFVEAHTGEPLDLARLRAVVERTNRARSVLLETYALARSVPSPLRSRDLVNFGIVIPLLLGTEAAVEVALAYRDELKRTVAAGASGVPGEEVRLLWLQNRIQFRSPLEDLLVEQHAAVVIDELNDITWEPVDPDDPFLGMARRALSVPLTGSVEYRVRNLQRLAREYRVQGAINPCHWGCRQGTGARGLVEAGLEAVGVPVLNLEVDCVDPRNFSPGQLRTRIQAFVEMLAARPPAESRPA